MTHWQRWIIASRTYLTSNPFLSVAWPKSVKVPRFYSTYCARVRTPEKRSRNTSSLPQRTDWRGKKKENMILGKTSRLTWRCDRYVIHTRLTTPVRSTTARSDSVTFWTKEKGNVWEFNYHRHHHHWHHRHHRYSRKEVFPQEASARGRILCGKQ